MPEFNLPVGEIYEKEFEVKPEHSAAFLDSGNVSVFSTPSMILFMENTSRIFADNHLPEGYTTVGVKVCIEHLAAAPIGVKVKVTSKLIKQENRRLTFEVKTYWEEKLLGEGIHERFIINHKKFMEKINNELKK